MVQALIQLDERSNRVLNIVKAQHGLKTKSEAVQLVVHSFEDELLEPELSPEFVKRLKKREKEPRIRITDFDKQFGLE